MSTRRRTGSTRTHRLITSVRNRTRRRHTGPATSEHERRWFKEGSSTMRRRLLTMTMMGAAVSGVLHAQAATQVGVREVAASERGVISLATKIRYTTMIILPDTEVILDVLCGDKEFWI